MVKTASHQRADSSSPRMFMVKGPFVVAYKKINDDYAVKPIGKQNLGGHENDIGCYVFAKRSAKGFRPLYVGMTTNSFAHEVFSPKNLQVYTNEIPKMRKGTPVVFLVVADTKRGRSPRALIHEVENFLIQSAIKRYPALRNKNGINEPEWEIDGIIPGTQGRPSGLATKFRIMMGLR